jgi:hypothetical protein
MRDLSLDISDERATELLNLLNKDGCFNDENSGLGSDAVEFHHSLEHGGHFYSNYAAVYWLYDPRRMTLSDARRHTDRWVEARRRLLSSNFN